ncbi:MAG TPA: hypothetical protein VGX92_11815 [Pyrinomonadaceae bacterium]|nr:hypothetical protein [Pyrinomonadaceae bacterium]
MSHQWQISAGEFFELMRPASWTLSALLSTGVLASARRQGFKPYWTWAWTLSTLFFPFIILPLYLLARTRARRRRRRRRDGEALQGPGPTEHAAELPVKASAAAYTLSASWTRILPALYLVACLSLIALFFYRDYGSLDAHLWRANNAKLRGPHAKVIAEYRAALRLEDDPHTRKLLAIELAAAGRAEEALAEFRAAERGGEPDEQIPYRMGVLLDTLGRTAEAAIEYDRFLSARACTQAPPDALCVQARARVARIRAAATTTTTAPAR